MYSFSYVVEAYVHFDRETGEWPEITEGQFMSVEIFTMKNRKMVLSKSSIRSIPPQDPGRYGPKVRRGNTLVRGYLSDAEHCLAYPFSCFCPEDLFTGMFYDFFRTVILIEINKKIGFY